MLMYLYHYCLIKSEQSGARYISGAVEAPVAVNTAETYKILYNQIAKAREENPDDVAMLSFSLVHTTGE